MTKKFLLLILGLALFSGCGRKIPAIPMANTDAPELAQETTLSEIPPTKENDPNEFNQFVPEGWEILDKQKGDLNADGRGDAILVIQKIVVDDDATIQLDQFRRLVVLFQQSDNEYTVSASSSKAIMCRNCGGMLGDPYVSTSMLDNSFAIEHYGGSRDRWDYIHTFTWQDGGWFLTEKAITAADNFLLTSRDDYYNYITGEHKITYSVPDNYRTDPEFTEQSRQEILDYWDKPEEIKKFPIKPLIRLDDFDISHELY